MKRRLVRLTKQAARDAEFQRKIVQTKLNKGTFQSRLFRHMFIQRRNALVPEDFQSKSIRDLFDTLKDDEMSSEDDHDSENSENEDEDSDEDAETIKDEFLDMHFDFLGNIKKAKLEVKDRKKTDYLWSGQDILLDYDP